jgi:hypothetical protein
MMPHDVVRSFDCGVPEVISLLCLKTRCSNAGTTALVYHRFNKAFWATLNIKNVSYMMWIMLP